MLLIPKAVFIRYVAHLKSRGVPAALHADYQKWLRYFLDFCDKYPVPSGKSDRVRLFCEKLRRKSGFQVNKSRRYMGTERQRLCRNRTFVFRPKR